MINPQKLHQELLTAGLPVDGVHEDGTVDWTRTLTLFEQSQAAKVIQVHDPTEIVLPGIEDRLAAIEDAFLAQMLGGV